MIDADYLRDNTELLSIVSRSTTLKKTGVNWWCGPCPFCGGKDRFVLHNTGHGWRWLCRGCGDGKYHNVIDYVMQRDGAGFSEACEILGGGNYKDTVIYKPPENAPLVESQPNNADNWQEIANKIVQYSESNLWGNTPGSQKALDYLRKERGLTDATIKKQRLGLSYGDYVGRIYVTGGIIIPAFAKGQIWYIKIRLLEGIRYKCQNRDCRETLEKPGICPFCGEKNKYRGVPGGKAAIYGLESLSKKSFAVLVEGEFDCMIVNQAIGEKYNIGVFTLGSQSAVFDWITWGKYLMPLEGILAAYDSDGTSDKGIQKIVATSDLIYPIVIPRLMPGDKDMTDFILAGGDLSSWILGELACIGMDSAQFMGKKDLINAIEKQADRLSTAAREANELGDFDRASNLTACFNHYFDLIEKL